MRALDLFSGIGGFARACEMVGISTVAFCEIDLFCQAVLRKRFPKIPVYDDIRTLKGAEFDVDLICGGFPCQPYSVAGRRKGASDPRDLWPEMCRVIGEAKPRWVCAENTPGFVGLGLDQALSDLEALGYETGAVVLPALGVGAPHIRQRLFIVANRNEPSSDGCSVQAGRLHTTGDCQRVAESNGKSPQRPSVSWEECNPWHVEPDVGRVVNGVPHRVDRLRALGNAVVPMQVVPILQGIIEADVLGR